MNYIVIDLEWNQSIGMNTGREVRNSTGNAAGKENEFNRKTLQFEIIEIGAVKLNEQLEEISTFSSLIKPAVHKKMNPYIAQITGIREKEFQKASKFQTVIQEFLNWCGKDYIMCTFGSQDIHELEMNMHYHRYPIPWKYPVCYIDIQRIFGIENGEPNEQRSLEMVSIYMGIEQKKTYHRALSDAIYTAEIMKKMRREDFLKYQSLDYINLPAVKKEAKEFSLGTHLEYLSVGYSSKEEVIKDKDNYLTRCPVCLKKCRKKIKWYADTNRYLCVSKCEEHGLSESILTMKNHFNGYFAVRKTFMITEEKYLSIKLRKKTLREKRKIKKEKERRS